MNSCPTSCPTRATAAPSTLIRFAVVGATGFIIDATILTLLVHFAGWVPWAARALSFATAVSATWLMNRRYTFAGRESQEKVAEAFWYGLIQVGGALINLGIFAVLLRYFGNRLLVIPLAVGAVGGLAFNFTASSLWLYARR